MAEADVVTIFLGGDLMTGRGIDQIERHPGAPRLYEEYVADARAYVELAERAHGEVPRAVRPEYIWGEALAELERRAPDARIVNLETSVTTSDEPWFDKSVHYRMHPENVECLTVAHLDVCSLANNHVADFGRAGLMDTLEALSHAGIHTAGAGRTLEEARAPAVVEHRFGGRILLFACGTYSAGVPLTWAATENRSGVQLLAEDEASAASFAARARALGRSGDVVIASIHWGSNWGYDVSQAQKAFAHRLIDDGVDVVFGHSSHHPRGIEIYRGKLILYGCGELIDDYEGISGYEDFRGDLVLLYFAHVDARTGALADLEMTPMRIRRLRLERAAPDDALFLAERLRVASAPLGTGGIALDGEVLRLRPEARG